MTTTIRSGLLALCALLTALVAPAPAGADAVVANLVRDTPVSAYGGWLAWSDYDAESQRYRLVLQVGDQTVPAAMRDSARAFDVSLGPDARGRIVALYTRCRTGDRGCDIYRYDVLARREHKLAGVSSPSLDEAWPAQWRQRITFVRRARTYVMDGYDHRPDPRGKRGGGPLMDCDVPYVRTLPARGAARRLDRGQCGVTTGMSIRGDSIVQVSDENQGGAGSESQVRQLRAGGGRSRLLARAGGGEGGYSPFVSASQSASTVWLTRTGNRAPANLLRIDIASKRLTEVAPHLPLAGRVARDERGVFWYVQGPEPPEEYDAEPPFCSLGQPCRLIRASADPFSALTRTLAPRITLSPAAANAPAPGTGPVAIAGDVTSEIVRAGASLRRDPRRGVVVELLRSTGGAGQGTYATTGLTTTTDAAGHWAFAVSPPPSPASFVVVARTLAITSTPIVVGG
jgi:hypothetical protein